MAEGMSAQKGCKDYVKSPLGDLGANKRNEIWILSRKPLNLT